MVSLRLQHLADDVHDFGLERWEPHKDAVNDARGEHLELRVNILDELDCWLAKLLQLRLDEEVEHVDGGEARNGVTFVQRDCLLDDHVRVLLRRIEVRILAVQLVEAHLYAGTSLQFLPIWVLGLRILSPGVILALNLVFVGLHELSDHIPQQVHFVGLVGRHGGSQVTQLVLSLL